MSKTAPLLALVLLGLLACRKETPKEMTMTSGHSVLLATESHEWLLKQEADEFSRQYPEATLNVLGTSTRDAIVQLLNDSVRTICVDRRFNDEEQAVIRNAGMKIIENKIAEDALAVIVNQENPLKNISLDLAKRILDGSATRWEQVGGSKWQKPVTLVLTGRNSGANELLQKKFFQLMKEIEPGVVVRTQREAVEEVSKTPGAVSFVSLAALSPMLPTVRMVGVEVKDSVGSVTFVKPSQMDIYQGLYPFHYSLYLYNNESKAGIGAGFSTYAMTVAGQKIIQNSGLVPAVIPTRRIQLNAE
ncbi:MAG: substrate-binding domain-containing protein [Bacteroidota bacterium]